jgi:chromodomain-helicase-DNA-binding protein 1
MSESDASADDNASDDGDFDMQQSSPSQHEDQEELEALDDGIPTITRASSSDSSRPAKRKAKIEEDEYIMANPELYGLRRSVWLASLNLHEYC